MHCAGGGNYQKLINQVLRSYVAAQLQHEPLESVIRRVVREELRSGRVEHGERELLVLKIAMMTVVRRDTHLLITYQQQDVVTAAGAPTSARLEQTAWVVDVDTRGTEDLSDDRLTVSGGDQSLFALAGARQQGDVTQVALGNAVFSAGCRKNPTQGIAVVERAGTEGGGMLLFTFHSACDGRADVTGAMAPYALMLGESVPLDFLE